MSEAVAALQRSHGRLVGLCERLSEAELEKGSYCRDWTIAQVLSHVGSGAEIATVALKAAQQGAEPPTREEYRKIWRRWDAMSPVEQRDGARAADTEMVELLTRVKEESPQMVLASFRGPVDLDTYAALRLSEHAVHVWDIEVVENPDARLDGDTAALILGQIAPMVGRLASSETAADLGPAVVAVEGVSRPWRLALGPEVTLSEGDGPADGLLHASDDSLLRLVYGRLDPAPADVSVSGPVDLDDLRRLFPGF